MCRLSEIQNLGLLAVTQEIELHSSNSVGLRQLKLTSIFSHPLCKNSNNAFHLILGGTLHVKI